VVSPQHAEVRVLQVCNGEAVHNVHTAPELVDITGATQALPELNIESPARRLITADA
jgi:hypothetical protein